MLLGQERRAALRIERATCRGKALRHDVTAWLDQRLGQARFARFTRHFEVLRLALTGLLDKVDARLRELEETPSLEVGLAYERCRAAESSLQVIRRVFDWYASKYEQREDANQQFGTTLLAADEIVRSCWTEPFATLGRSAPAAPLVYLDSRFDALSTPRVTAPPDLRAPGDKLIADLVRTLPIGTIALPSACPDEPWWLVLAIHETGHHVLNELQTDFTALVRTALTAAVADEQLKDDWDRWVGESFADAFSVLMAGAAAQWAVGELQYGAPEAMASAPQTGDRYPPPIVRLALMGEIAHALGLTGTYFDCAGARMWLSGQQVAEVVARHVELTPAVAAALAGVEINGKSLSQLCDWHAERFAPKASDAAVWAAQLTLGAPIIPKRRERWAARVGIAGGVAALQRLEDQTPATNDGLFARLVANLPLQLKDCGGPGVLAAPPRADDVTDIVERIAAQLPDAPRAEAED